MDNDLISRKAVLSLPRNTTRNFFGEIVEESIDVADIEALPSVQPEIIRCKDCKYHDERYRRISVKWLPCMEIRTDGNWFCASAERREE